MDTDNKLKRNLALAVLFAMCFASVFHALYYYPRLPDRVPSNFDFEGNVNSWTGRKDFMLIYMFTSIGTAAIFAGVGYGLKFMPHSKINMPNKEYWLADERREESLAYMSRWLIWLASGTVFFIIHMFHGCFEVALDPGAIPKNFGLEIAITAGGYIGAMAVWIIVMYRRFGKPIH